MARIYNAEAKRRSNLKVRYGITPEEYDDILYSQGGGCAICGASEKLVIDHCHETGAVRGILCGTCNRGLGMLGDNKAGIRLALQYLNR